MTNIIYNYVLFGLYFFQNLHYLPTFTYWCIFTWNIWSSLISWKIEYCGNVGFMFLHGGNWLKKLISSWLLFGSLHHSLLSYTRWASFICSLLGPSKTFELPIVYCTLWSVFKRGFWSLKDYSASIGENRLGEHEKDLVEILMAVVQVRCPFLLQKP